MEIKNLTDAVLTAFDSMPVNTEFYANELKAKASELYPEASHKYENSILMKIRKHRREFYHCVDRRGKLIKTGDISK